MVAVLIDTLYMLSPQDIPSDRIIADWMQGNPLSEMIRPQTRDTSRAFNNLAMAEELQCALAKQAAAGREIADPQQGQPDDLAHDAYFNVRRVEHDVAAVFLQSVVAGRLIFLREVEESPVAISVTELMRIDRGFADLLGCLFGGEIESAAHVQRGKHAVKQSIPSGAGSEDIWFLPL